MLVILSARQLRGLAAFHVHRPHVPALVRSISLAVHAEIGARYAAGDDTQLLLLLVFLALQRLRIFLAKLQEQARPIWRPAKASDAPLEVGQLARLAAMERHQIDLRLLLILAVGEKGNRFAVRRPTWAAVTVLAISELSRFTAISGHNPQVAKLFLVLLLHPLFRVHNVCAIGRDLWILD